MSRRCVFYLRVSTSEQTTQNQRIELERWAVARGYEVVDVYEDHGISGAKGRDKRPQFDRMLKDAARRKFDVLGAWSVDRLGRSLQHLVETLGELHATGVDLYLAFVGAKGAFGRRILAKALTLRTAKTDKSPFWQFWQFAL